MNLGRGLGFFSPEFGNGIWSGRHGTHGLLGWDMSRCPTLPVVNPDKPE